MNKDGRDTGQYLNSLIMEVPVADTHRETGSQSQFYQERRGSEGRMANFLKNKVVIVVHITMTIGMLTERKRMMMKVTGNSLKMTWPHNRLKQIKHLNPSTLKQKLNLDIVTMITRNIPK